MIGTVSSIDRAPGARPIMLFVTYLEYNTPMRVSQVQLEFEVLVQIPVASNHFASILFCLQAISTVSSSAHLRIRLLRRSFSKVGDYVCEESRRDMFYAL